MVLAVSTPEAFDCGEEQGLVDRRDPPCGSGVEECLCTGKHAWALKILDTLSVLGLLANSC